MKRIAITIFLFSTLSSFAQNVTKEELETAIKPLNEKIISLQSENGNRKKEIKNLQAKLADDSVKIDSLQKQTKSNDNAITQASTNLGSQIKQTGESNEKKISEVDQSLSKTSLYGIIGVLSAILLSGLLYFLLSKRQKSDKSDMIEQLSKTKSSIEESLVKEFGKQTELMDTELHLIEKQKNNLQSTPNAEPDHSLALKVASEINLIERNVNLMDTKTKGLKQLIASVGKLKDNLSANGYEMPELLGKQFHQGMKVIVTSSIPDENLEKGSEIISKIIIPQVNYNDKMIQTAQIEVSVG